MGRSVDVCGVNSFSWPWYRPRKLWRNSIAEAGRFMTKWEMVGGMGRRVGSGRGLGDERETLAGLMRAWSPRREAARTESAAWRMKSWPSALNGLTNSETWMCKYVHEYLPTYSERVVNGGSE